MALERAISDENPRILIEGSFLKKGPSNASLWKERYFVLYDNNILTYADSKGDVAKNIDLRDVEYVEDDDKNVSYFWNYPKGIAMKTINKQKAERIYHFCFKSQELRDLWRNELKECIKYNNKYLSETKQEIQDRKNKIIEIKLNAVKLKKNLEIKNRRYKLKNYKNCFVGEDAIKIIINLNIAMNEDKAIKFGNLLIENNIIEHVENDHTFINGRFFYRFIEDDNNKNNKNNNNNDDNNDNDIILEHAIKTAKSQQDIMNLMRRCKSDNIKTERLYKALCDRFPSSKNHKKYEQWMGNLGRIDAYIHFMNRFKFLILPYSIIDNEDIFKTLNNYTQCINYDELQTIRYNYKYLEKHYEERRRHTLHSPHFKPFISVRMAIERKEEHDDIKSIPRSNSMSSPTANSPINIQQKTRLSLKQIHNMKEIELFAALPIPTKIITNNNKNISINNNNNNDDDSNGFLFRLLTYRGNDYCDKVISAIKKWDNSQLRQFSLYEIEEYVGLMFYKCCKDYYCSKYSAEKIPIPWKNKIKDISIKQFLSSNSDIDDDEDDDDDDDDDGINIDFDDIDIDDYVDDNNDNDDDNDDDDDNDNKICFKRQQNQNANLSQIFLEIDKETQETCIEAFDRIVSGKDNDFPVSLNMFNAMILVWIIYRNHCGHIKYGDDKKLKFEFFRKLINNLCKEFFMELKARKHLTKYILILHYFACSSFGDVCNDNINIYNDYNDPQTDIFEMALNVLKMDHKSLSWMDKSIIIDFLDKYKWIKYYKKDNGNIELYFKRQLKYIDIELNKIYKNLKQNENYKYIDTEIKIISGNIIFRQDHQHVLGSKWFDIKNLKIKKNKSFINNTDFINDINNINNINDINDKERTFELNVSNIMINIAKYLSPHFSKVIESAFCKNNTIKVFELNVKSMDIITLELDSMSDKNIKFPKSASIRDYMSCLVVFPSINEMLSGYERLKKLTKIYDGINNNTLLKLVHIDNGISKKYNIKSLIIDNFRLLNIHCIFKYKQYQLIGEICFTLHSIWKTYSIKKHIINQYTKLLNKEQIYKITKSLSISTKNIDYDWKINKLHHIQNKYLNTIL